ncbi:HD-GYP domain-containing protein [Virgibacillus sp. FSP13]
MHVNPSQLIPGCVLIRDVMGKTSRPIIPKNTVLTEQHITILHKFLIESVDVAAKLEDGELFKPTHVHKEQKQNTSTDKEINHTAESFLDHYMHVVKRYKKLFNSWQNHGAINMPMVRKLVIPLIERISEIGSDIFRLNHYVQKQDYFYHHSVSLGILSAYIARKMGYQKGEWLQIGLAGFLCDCGMSRVNPNIVMKEDDLSSVELDEIKKHPTYSYRLIEQKPTITNAVKLAVVQHHERMDGSGYPLGLSKEKIHSYARIIAVCDLYHAMTCERLYRERQSPFKAIEQLQNDQFSQLDHQVVQAFIKNLTNFSTGTKVRLSNHHIGEIVFIEEKDPTRPIVRLDETNEIITLKSEPSLYIDEIL